MADSQRETHAKRIVFMCKSLPPSYSTCTLRVPWFLYVRRKYLILRTIQFGTVPGTVQYDVCTTPTRRYLTVLVRVLYCAGSLLHHQLYRQSTSCCHIKYFYPSSFVVEVLQKRQQIKSLKNRYPFWNGMKRSPAKRYSNWSKLMGLGSTKVSFIVKYLVLHSTDFKSTAQEWKYAKVPSLWGLLHISLHRKEELSQFPSTPDCCFSMENSDLFPQHNKQFVFVFVWTVGFPIYYSSHLNIGQVASLLDTWSLIL